MCAIASGNNGVLVPHSRASNDIEYRQTLDYSIEPDQCR